MYNSKMVAVIKQNGSILREHDNNEGGNKDCVTIPYGQEYSILIKNLESRRASVDISIDGADVLFGKSLVLEPNSEIEIERFLDDLDEGNKFKFIKKTQGIVKHRGDKIDDGIVKIDFRYEKQYEEVNTYYRNYYNGWIGGSPFGFPYTVCKTSNGLNNVRNFSCKANLNIGSSVGGEELTSSVMSNINQSAMDSFPEIKNDEGITGRGEISNQKFQRGYIGELEDSKHTIVLRLKGTDKQGISVKTPVTVKTKLQCDCCGKISKFGHKFCPECGNALAISKVS